MMRALPRICCIALLLLGTRAGAQTNLLDSIIHPDSLKALVAHIASDSMKGRYTGTMANVKAAEFIALEFKKVGLRALASNKGYFVPFTATPPGKVLTSYNVVAALPGKSRPQEVVIFCAHFDHIGMGDEATPRVHRGETTKRDAIFNGANDNASGVAGIIALARYYSKLQNNERTLLFVAFSGEELGMQGSAALVNNFKPESVMAVVNLEMLGRAPDGLPANPFITGSVLSDFRKVLNNELERQDAKKFRKNYFLSDAALLDDYFSRSDNYPFAQVGIPAHTIMLGNDLDPLYHTVNDEAETLNYPLMAKIVQAVALGCKGLTDGSVTLKRLPIPRKKEKKHRDTVPPRRVVSDQEE
jgi:hypothetical protein